MDIDYYVKLEGLVLLLKHVVQHSHRSSHTVRGGQKETGCDSSTTLSGPQERDPRTSLQVWCVWDRHVS